MGFSWAADGVERDQWIKFASRLAGLQIERVRYFTVDYRRWEIAPEQVGVREITDESEWAEPAFRFPGGHTLDYGLELTDPSGQAWSLTWIPPAMTEGLALYDEAMVPNVLSGRSSISAWDVTTRTEWRHLVGESVVSVQFDFEPWDNTGSWWCRRGELRFASRTVELLQADGLPDGTLGPSADNIVVRFL